MAANFRTALERRNQARDELAAELESQNRQEIAKRSRRRMTVLVLGAVAVYFFHKRAVQPAFANLKQIQDSAKALYAARKQIAANIATETKEQMKNSGKTMLEGRSPSPQAAASPRKVRSGKGQSAGGSSYEPGKLPVELGSKTPSANGKGKGKRKDDYSPPPSSPGASPSPPQLAESRPKPKREKSAYRLPGSGDSAVPKPRAKSGSGLAKQDKYEHVGSAVPRALSENTAQFPGVVTR